MMKLSEIFSFHRVSTEKKPLVKVLKLVTVALLFLILAAILFVMIANCTVKWSVAGKILDEDEYRKAGKVDCIIVLGCGLNADGTPSDMLYDRIKTACELYHQGIADTLLFSGDHGDIYYNEVGAMMRCANKEFGVPLEDIFLDHAGFSTYETMARAATVFGVKKAIVVTQKYHLYRALFLAESYGIEAFGVSASLRTYRGQTYRDLREIAARCKDLFSAIFKPAFVMGEPIDLEGDSKITQA